MGNDKVEIINKEGPQMMNRYDESELYQREIRLHFIITEC